MSHSPGANTSLAVGLHVIEANTSKHGTSAWIRLRPVSIIIYSRECASASYHFHAYFSNTLYYIAIFGYMSDMRPARLCNPSDCSCFKVIHI